MSGFLRKRRGAAVMAGMDEGSAGMGRLLRIRRLAAGGAGGAGGGAARAAFLFTAAAEIQSQHDQGGHDEADDEICGVHGCTS